ncbi:root hair defective 3 GTP-binding protein [Globomyces pollinis-pini]|nr:root hair defective 3 GTP-binding protein [Globomyces pollinis-pini]
MTENTKQLQVIDENQKFNHNISMNTWDIQEVGFDYHLIAVFGSQSTGKSTLLNHLFGTQFDVMNATSGRSQTTKGIWISKAANSNLLVLDVEGTDGRERGEDQDFERKSALFSLATAEVVIVNMWEQAVGLYNGANMTLLRTVFEVNLQLFQKDGQSKTLLYFIFRDSTGQAPVETLGQTMKTDLEKLWAGISKPAGKETALLSDYFEFEFSSVAHKIFALDKFNSDMNDIQKRFYEKSADNYVLKPKYHKGIPADGFPHFAESIWEKIMSNRDLDLPTQQQLLAQFRCEEITKTLFEKFTSSISHLRPLLESGQVISNFGKDTSVQFETSLESFDKSAKRYHAETYEKKRIDFIEKFSSSLQVLFLQQLRNLHKRSLALFQKSITDKLRTDDSDFTGKLAESKELAVNDFTTCAAESKLKGSDWNYDDYFQSFLKDIDELAAQKRADALQRLSKLIEKTMTQKLAEPINVIMHDSPVDLWSIVLKTLAEVVNETKAVLEKKLTGLGADAETIAKTVLDMKIQAWNLLLKVAQDEVIDVQIMEKLRKRFESSFRYDDRGIPRVWKPTDDIDTLFALSKEKAEKLLVIISKISVPLTEIDADIINHEDFDPTSVVIINASRQQSIKERFHREAETLFVEAKRSTVSSITQIPTWFIMLTVALGWNEILAILRNPLFTLITLLSIGSVYFLWYTSMGGPVLQIAKATTGEFYKQGKEQLRARGIEIDEYIDGTYATKLLEFVNGSNSKTPGRLEEVEMVTIAQATSAGTETETDKTK